MVFDHGGQTGETPEPRSSPVSRRAFLATAVGASGVGASAAREQEAETKRTQKAELATRQQERETAATWYMTDELEWIYERVDDETVIPVLIEVLDPEELRRFEEFGTETRRSKAPEPAVYAKLTPEELSETALFSYVTRLRFAPGANPFWTVGNYRNGVFPDPTEAVDYIAYEEALAGLSRLESEHPDRLAVRTVGQTVGLDDEFAGKQVTYGVPLIELTDGVSAEDAFDGKETIVCSLSIHGDERSGVEGGLRFVERVLTGDEPEIAAKLDELGFVFVLSNPDGWMGRDPTTVNVEEPRSDAFMRHTGADVDPNRQYPTAGLIDPAHNPAEPDGTNLVDDTPGVDDDIDSEYRETVPDSLSIVEALRSYDSVAVSVDYHGMYGDSTLLKALYENNEYGVHEQGRLDVLNAQLRDRLEGRVAELLAENEAAIEAAAEARGGGAENAPETVFNHGTIFDTIGYTVPGGMGNWLGQAVDQGGLDAPSLTFEMALDNSPPGVSLSYRPQLLEVHTAAIWETLREFATHVRREIDTDIRAGDGGDVGYVTTDALTRRSEDLPFDESPTVREWNRTLRLSGTGDERLTIPLDESVHTLSVSVRHAGGRLEHARLDDPAGLVRREDPITDGEFGRGSDWLLTDVEDGTWHLAVDGDRGAAASVHVTAVAADDPPDPREVIGYEQREYTVSPLAYFEAYDEALAGASTTELTVEAVANGALLDAGEPAVDQLVLVHDDGAAEQGYVDALAAYVEAGGELVLTDSAVSLLASLDVDGASQLAESDVESKTFPLAIAQEKRDDQLLEGVRPIERELATVLGLGYSLDGETPMVLVDQDAFEAVGGTVAATTQGDVIAGRLGSITVVGCLFPPGYQQNLHPFGLNDHALSAMGQQLFRNALGHTQGGSADTNESRR